MPDLLTNWSFRHKEKLRALANLQGLRDLFWIGRVELQPELGAIRTVHERRGAATQLGLVLQSGNLVHLQHLLAASSVPKQRYFLGERRLCGGCLGAASAHALQGALGAVIVTRALREVHWVTRWSLLWLTVLEVLV